jgi:hypothetical protein
LRFNRIESLPGALRMTAPSSTAGIALVVHRSRDPRVLILEY